MTAKFYPAFLFPLGIYMEPVLERGPNGNSVKLTPKKMIGLLVSVSQPGSVFHNINTVR